MTSRSHSTRRSSLPSSAAQRPAARTCLRPSASRTVAALAQVGDGGDLDAGAPPARAPPRARDPRWWRPPRASPARCRRARSAAARRRRASRRAGRCRRRRAAARRRRWRRRAGGRGPGAGSRPARRGRGRRSSPAPRRRRGPRRRRRGPARPARARARGRPRPARARRARGPRRPARRRRRPRRRRSRRAARRAPPPTTSTSAWRRRYSVRHSRSSWEARSLPEAGGVAQHLLVQRPQPPRADEGLVVEARRRERAADGVGHGHHVVLEAGGGVEVLDRHALAHRLGAGAHAGRAVDGHEAVGALPGAAQQAAPAVVLEAARERALAGGEQRRGDGVARERLDALAVEGEADGRSSGRCARRAAAGSRLTGPGPRRAAPSSARRWCACRARR